MLFRTVPSPTACDLLFRKIGGFVTPSQKPKTPIAIISVTGEDTVTDFKFDRYILTVHANKSSLKILVKRERGRIQGLPQFLGTPNYLRNG